MCWLPRWLQGIIAASLGDNRHPSLVQMNDHDFSQLASHHYTIPMGLHFAPEVMSDVPSAGPLLEGLSMAVRAARMALQVRQTMLKAQVALVREKASCLSKTCAEASTMVQARRNACCSLARAQSVRRSPFYSQVSRQTLTIFLTSFCHLDSYCRLPMHCSMFDVEPKFCLRVCSDLLGQCFRWECVILDSQLYGRRASHSLLL